jgi:magnesium chelatase family protein
LIAIVAAVLAVTGQRVFGAEELGRTVLMGEVGLDGRLRPVRGILPATLAAQQAGFKRVIVPLRQAGEAKLVAGSEVFGIGSITQLVAFLRGIPMPPVCRERGIRYRLDHSAGRFSARHPDAARRSDRGDR